MKILDSLQSATCPACGHHVAARFYNGGSQPLATLAWPATAEEAEALPRYRIDFVRCVDCGHVYNPGFDYQAVPYSRKPNLMFNRGTVWSSFIVDRQKDILSRLPARPVVVEIGHGDGSFLFALSQACPEGRYVGFDPHGAAVGAGSVDFRAELFDPCRHLEELRPDIIISRHVLEHLTNPLGFLQRIALVATIQQREVLSYFEVPCIENALENQRTVDFYYEHSSQFTTESFTRMLKRCASAIEEIGHGYDREVIYGFTRLGQNGAEHQVEIARQAEEFHTATGESLTVIRDQLAEILAGGRRVAVWGGTGKSAAFICRYGLDRQRFPLVVDSDPDKVGTFVPGTGQVIRFRDYLKEHPVDVLIIPPQWRAGDILAEMREQHIVATSILIEHQGRLVPLEAGAQAKMP